MTMTDTIWEEARYDSGWYGVAVTRKGDHAYLTVTLLGTIDHLLHRETVKCEGRADTDKWRTRAQAVISNPDLRTIDAL